jgi:hypothetical protein
MRQNETLSQAGSFANPVETSIIAPLSLIVLSGRSQNPRLAVCGTGFKGQVAQLVEQRTDNTPRSGLLRRRLTSHSDVKPAKRAAGAKIRGSQYAVQVSRAR